MNEMDFELLALLKESKNITKTAEMLYISQSALSKRIKALEREIGKELMVRSHQGIRFTPAGEAVLSHIEHIRAELDVMRTELEQMDGEICGTLNAGISINFSQCRLPDILASYHKKYPRVRLQITTGQSRHLYRQMAEGSLDIAVLRGDYSWDGFRYLLSREAICMVCNQKYQNQSLDSFPYIGRQTDPAHAADIARWMRENNAVHPTTGFCMDSISSCLEIVKRGIGWSLLPSIALDRYDGIKKPCVFSDGTPFVRNTYVISQPAAMELPQVTAFIEELKAFA